MFDTCNSCENAYSRSGGLQLYDGYHELTCHACKGYGIVIACDYCPLVYHPSCLNPKLKQQPIDYWACPICLQSIRRGKIKEIMKRCEDYSRFSIINTILSDSTFSQYFKELEKNKNQEIREEAVGPSNYRGVYFRNNRWNAQIQAKGKKHYLGSFFTEIEAAKCYDNAAIRFHGKRAKLNFPQDTCNNLNEAKYQSRSPTSSTVNDTYQPFSNEETLSVNNYSHSDDTSSYRVPTCIDSSEPLTPTMLLPYDFVQSEIIYNREYINNNYLG